MVDGGDLFWRSNNLPAPAKERAVQVARLLAEGTALAGIDAMGLTGADLALGWDVVSDLARQHNLPYVATNLQCTGEPPFPTWRTAERGGIKVGFLGMLPSDAQVPGCTVTGPNEAAGAVAAQVAGLDVTVVLGAVDNEQARALVTTVPNAAFLVPTGQVTLATIRSLDDDHYLLGVGPKGKKVGVIKGTLVDGGVGWSTTGQADDTATRLDRFKKRLEDAKGRLAQATDEKVKMQAQRQVSFYESEIAKLETELTKATTPRAKQANAFVNEMRDLAASITDHAATRALVDKVEATLPPEVDVPEPMKAKAEGGPRDLRAIKAPKPGAARAPGERKAPAGKP